MTRHEPVVLSRAKSATFISVILQNNKNTVQLHFGCTVFFEFTDNAVQSCSCTALPNKRAAIHCTISLSLASSGMALQNARAAAFESTIASGGNFVLTEAITLSEGKFIKLAKAADGKFYEVARG